ncbi:MAG TPA: sensor histidine kinase [Chitinophagales bacterium]|nr:sensor histidine kinase [Chitinophagales bacterium]
MNSRQLITILQKRVTLHVVFWLVWALALGMGYVGKSYPLTFLLANYVGVMVLYFLWVNTSLYIIYDKLISRHRLLLALLAFVGLLVLFTNANAWLYNVSNSEGKSISFQNFLAMYVFLAAFAMALKAGRAAYLALYHEMQAKEELLRQKEYFLRSQIHPHFLFNTLNNFYGLALEKADTLPGLMLRLSNILRHQIYHSESEYILLEKEIDYLKDYIELEKIRHSDNLRFVFSFPQQVPPALYVPPAVMIVFLENAFKHSSHVAGNLVEITGHIKIENDRLFFYLENTFPQRPPAAGNNPGGIGLKNVVKRLELYGNDTNKLDMGVAGNRYIVKLEMKLKQHEKV